MTSNLSGFFSSLGAQRIHLAICIAVHKVFRKCLQLILNGKSHVSTLQRSHEMITTERHCTRSSLPVRSP